MPGALVDAGWLREQLGDAALRLIHVGVDEAGRAAYDEAHVAGALWADGYADFTEDREFRALVPSKAAMERTLGRLGVLPEHTVALYASGRSPWPARAYWVLRYYRFPSVHIVDGSLDVLRDAGLPVTGDDPQPQPQPVAVELPEPDRSLLATAEQVLSAAQGSGESIVDCRTDEEWEGLAGGHAPPPRLGRIPRAVHMNWELLVDERGRFLPLDQLRALFTAAGIDGSRPAFPYCGGGVRSAVSWFAMRELLGFEGAANYDGSWSEWAARPELPVETG